MVWVHWVVYNIPPDTKSLPENAGKSRLPQGTLLGLNDFKKTGYGGPCPPIPLSATLKALCVGQ
jgi:Raf kinase inhibitor-like YbhB/YbcL family protein